MNRRSGLRCGGFTLIELMVTVAVAAILLALAVPGFQRFVMDSKRSEVINELVNSFQLARSEAMRRGQQIGLCASNDGSTCASANTNWSQGWIVFVNSDADTSPTRSNTEELLRVYGQPSTNIVVTASSAGTAMSGRFRARTFGQTHANGTITVCDPRGASEAKAVVVSTAGTVRLKETSLTCP